MRHAAAVVLVLAAAGCPHPGEPTTPPSPAHDEHYGTTIEDDEAWKLANPSRCEKPMRAADCTGVKEYLADFPNGKHAADAKALLDALAKKLETVPEETRWDAADVEGCKAGDDVEACEDVEGYLAKWPSGKHAAEARAMLEAAKPKIEARKKALESAGVDIEILGTDHSGKDCPPLLGDGEHHALCLVLDVRVRRAIKTSALGVTTDCGVEKAKPKQLHWATGADLTKVAIGKSVDLHVAVPRAKRCTVEVGLGNVPSLEVTGLRRLCLHADEDPTKDRAEPGSCPAEK